jgi:hypothetical protein
MWSYGHLLLESCSHCAPMLWWCSNHEGNRQVCGIRGQSTSRCMSRSPDARGRLRGQPRGEHGMSAGPRLLPGANRQDARISMRRVVGRDWMGDTLILEVHDRPCSYRYLPHRGVPASDAYGAGRVPCALRISRWDAIVAPPSGLLVKLRTAIDGEMDEPFVAVWVTTLRHATPLLAEDELAGNQRSSLRHLARTPGSRP